MSVAVIQLVIATPVQPDASASHVARGLRSEVKNARRIAAIIDALTASGWAMLPPAIVSDDGFADVIIYFAKPFASSDEAEADAAACGCVERLQFSFLWNWDGTFDDNGYPNYEWGGECA